MNRPDKLYHCTTPSRARKYAASKRIIAPVRGFDTLMGAMAWCVKTQRTVIYEVTVSADRVHMLPDHHNDYGKAWWSDDDALVFKCVFSTGEKIKEE